MRQKPSRPRLAAALLAATAALAVVPALAGIPQRDNLGTPVRWTLDIDQPNVKGGAILWYVDPLGSIEEPPGDTTERDAFVAAFDTWEQAPGSPLRFREETIRWAVDADATDRINYMGWKRYRLGPLTLAVTQSTHTDGVLKDTDIIFNDTKEIIRWATTDIGLLAHADVQSVATHEIGHVIGLDHSPAGNATMHFAQRAGSVSSRTLTADDIGAAVQAYPGLADPTRGTIIGTVTIGKRRREHGIPVFALDARTGEVAGSALTDRDGLYRIPSLPPGPYHLVAAPLTPRSVYAPWWDDAPSELLPAFHLEERPDGRWVPAVVVTRPGYPEVGRDIRVDRPSRKRRGEPDDTIDLARSVRVGETIVGRFETELDTDWVRVETGGEAIDVRLRAWALGADVDPELALADSNGILLRTVSDRRAPADPEYAHGPLGIDLDAEFLDVTPPADGVVLLRVRAQPQSEVGADGSFWTLAVLPSAGVPDAWGSTAVFDPEFVRAGVPDAARLVVTPRNVHGDTPSSDVTVMARFSDGRPDAVLTPAGDGTWRLTVDGPPAPGTLEATIELSTDRGRAVIATPARLTTAGVADNAASRFSADPRRVDGDGVATVLLVFDPRDGLDRRLGPGLDVTMNFDTFADGTLGPVEDLGDGTYVAVLTAPTVPGRARVRALIDGVAVGPPAGVGFGWELDRVAADLGVEIGQRLGLPAVTGGVRRRMEKASGALEQALELLATGDEWKAVRRTAKSVKAFERAGHDEVFPDATAAAAELAEALRRRVTASINVVVFPVPDPGGEVLRGKARALAARAASDLAAGEPARAARRLVKCAAVVRRIERRLP